MSAQKSSPCKRCSNPPEPKGVLRSEVHSLVLATQENSSEESYRKLIVVKTGRLRKYMLRLIFTKKADQSLFTARKSSSLQLFRANGKLVIC